MPKRKPKDPNRSADMVHEWIERHLARLERFLLYDPLDLTSWEYKRARLTGPGLYEKLDQKWGSIQIGERWGGPDTTAFFRKSITIPDSHAGPDTFLDIDMDGGETQLFIDGYPWQGLDFYRHLVPLDHYATAGRTIELTLEAFVINYPYDGRRHDERHFHRFARARLIKIDRKIEACLHDARFVLDAYLSHWHEDDNLEIEGFLRHHLETACRAIGPHLASREEARAAAAYATEVLRTHIFENGVYKRDGLINVCAHSHLDIVYLWPIKETFRKNGRTTSNMLSLMREYPDFLYSQSQPYLYEKLKEHYPALFNEVKQRINEGRWEVIGAMYIEPDGNLLGPESLVRQILFGKRFLRKEFGVDTSICWLPDVFGVLYTLPQILKKSGINYFLTAKLNIWNDTNDFPYDTFRWRGPDGSEVIAHFPPTHFAQDFTIDNLKKQWRDYREKQLVKENLFVYGWGDGGGGPTREMVSASLRAKQFPGLPQTRILGAEQFFQNLESKIDRLPVWDDELYLEAHRGTYTTKGDLKQLNRQAEILYRDAEILAAVAGLYGGPRVQEKLNEGWKLILLNQFHDTLPGTHIPAAVPDIKKDYQTALEIGATVRDEALAYLGKSVAKNTAADNDLLVFNTLGWERDTLVETSLRDDTSAVRVNGGDYQPVQHFDGRTWFQIKDLPSLGWTVVGLDQEQNASDAVTATYHDETIETPLYRIDLTADGNLAQIVDKHHDRDVLASPGNLLACFEDDPGFKFSAWDIAYHIEEYQYPVQQTSPWHLAANGPLFAVFTSRWQVLNSTIEQEMWLFNDHPRIDFRTKIDWRDQRKLLKVAFPLAIRTRTATYDLPFGHIERSTHRNTSWEQAKFEVCGHKWADLSEGDYGVALMNDCKYGYDARENVLRLSLLRSPVRPDGQSDIGHHQFTYSLLPHAGTWRQAQVVRRAYELNIPAAVVDIPTIENGLSANLPATRSMLKVDSDSLIVEVLKQAEDGDDLILRTFDSSGSRGKINFEFAVQIDDAAETDLLEENPSPLALLDNHTFVDQFKPYEIKTYRIKFDMGKTTYD